MIHTVPVAIGAAKLGCILLKFILSYIYMFGQPFPATIMKEAETHTLSRSRIPRNVGKSQIARYFLCYITLSSCRQNYLIFSSTGTLFPFCFLVSLEGILEHLIFNY